MKFLWTFLALLCLPSIASAQVTHYVTPSGAGAANGVNWNNAFAGLPATLARGDTYVLAGGTYSTQPNLGDADSGTTQIHIRKAQAGTYNGIAYNDDLVAGWSASFQTTQAVITRPCTVFNITTDYYDIDGVQPGSTFPPPSTSSSYGIEVTPNTPGQNCTLMDVRGTNERIQHVAFVSAGQSFDFLQFGMAMYDSLNSYVAHNYFVNSQNHIRLLGSQNATVEYNYLANISYFSTHHGEMINMLKSPLSGRMPANATIRFNYINDSGTSNTTGQIIDLGNTGDTDDGVFVYGNVFVNLTGHNGIGSGNSSTPASLTNWKFYNNTFINSVVDFSQISTAGSEFRNNLLYGSQAQVFAGSAPATRSNNYWNSTSNSIGSGLGDVISSESTSTLFQNYAGADYRLGASSQARNIGFTLPPPYNVDAYGLTRVPGAWDAGAYNSGTVSTVAPPTSLIVTVN